MASVRPADTTRECSAAPRSYYGGMEIVFSRKTARFSPSPVSATLYLSAVHAADFPAILVNAEFFSSQIEVVNGILIGVVVGVGRAAGNRVRTEEATQRRHVAAHTHLHYTRRQLGATALDPKPAVLRAATLQETALQGVAELVEALGGEQFRFCGVERSGGDDVAVHVGELQ